MLKQRKHLNLFKNELKFILVAKKKSLFDDRSAEIQELTYIIKGDLGSLNQQIAKLQEISKQQNRNNNGRHLQSHSSSVLLALQSRLASMSTDFKQVSQTLFFFSSDDFSYLNNLLQKDT